MFAFKQIIPLFLVLSIVGHSYSFDLTSEFLENETTEFTIVDQDLKHLVRTKKMINEMPKEENVDSLPPTTESPNDSQSISEKKDVLDLKKDDQNTFMQNSPMNLGKNTLTTEDNRGVFNSMENPNSDLTFDDKFTKVEEEFKKKDEEINRKTSDESFEGDSDDFNINDKGLNNEMSKNSSPNDQPAIKQSSTSKIISALTSNNLNEKKLTDDKSIEEKLTDGKTFEEKSTDEKLTDEKLTDGKTVEEKSTDGNLDLKELKTNSGSEFNVDENFLKNKSVRDEFENTMKSLDMSKDNDFGVVLNNSTDKKPIDEKSKNANHENHLNGTIPITSSSTKNSNSIFSFIFCCLITCLIVKLATKFN